MRTFPKELAKFRLLVDARGAELRLRSYDELLALARQPTENVEIEGRHATMGIIVQSRRDESLRVVVQGFMPSRIPLFGCSVALDGFYKLLDGTVEPMPDKEFYEFD